MFRRSEGNLELRPMGANDIPMALRIIQDYDDDDAADAQDRYNRGIDGQYCLCENRAVIGVVGGKHIPDTDGAFGLSWTYLQSDQRRSGKGAQMLNWMIEMMKEQEARKVFVHASDYVDPTQGDIYRDARDTYLQVGFTPEIRQADYYAPGESMLVYGMRLSPREVVNVVLNLDEIKLTDVDEIPETNDAYWLAWELVGQGQGTKPQDFHRIFDEVRGWGGRTIYMSFPSDVANSSALVTAARFKNSGRLVDYYEDGIDEIHYRYDV